MRAVVQRVSKARVTVEAATVGEIELGLMVLLGVDTDDGKDDVSYLTGKIAHLRIFDDGGGKMNLSVLDVGGSILVVSQFTLLGDCRQGRRPSFSASARPELAEDLYRQFVTGLTELGIPVATGSFGAHMVVEIFNDGPVTMLLDSKKIF